MRFQPATPVTMFLCARDSSAPRQVAPAPVHQYSTLLTEKAESITWCCVIQPQSSDTGCLDVKKLKSQEEKR